MKNKSTPPKKAAKKKAAKKKPGANPFGKKHIPRGKEKKDPDDDFEDDLYNEMTPWGWF